MSEAELLEEVARLKAELRAAKAEKFLWEAEALRARMLGLADWHDVKAHKATYYPGEGALNQAVMLKAAKVHTDAAYRIREALKDVGSYDS